MNYKPQLLSLAVAAISGAALWLYLGQVEAETSGGPKSSVLVATRDIAIGEMLDSDRLGLRQVPQAYLDQRHIPAEKLSALVGARVSTPIRAGESLVWSDLANMHGERRDLADLIAQGMRALPIPAGAEGLFGGLLRPGDRVDILYTARGAATVTLLQNVLVLAVGPDTQNTGHRATGPVVTVSLSPEQAQTVVHARTQGSLEVALRHPDDTLVLNGLPDTKSVIPESADARAKLSRRSAQQEDSHVR